MKRGLWGLVAGAFLGAAQPAAAQSGWEIAITPRLWYSIFNFNVSDSAAARFETATFPFYGGTVEVTTPWSRSTSFLITVLDGSDYNLRLTSFGERLGTAELHRRDIEALLRYRLGTNVSLFGGFRYISGRVRTTLDVPNLVFVNSGTPLSDNRFAYYFAEFGAGFSFPIDARGEHALFGNGLVGFGLGRSYDNNGINGSLFVIPLDVSAGYSWQFASCCSLHGRYRAFIIPAGNKTFKDLTAQHGPEIGVTFRFSF